MAIDTARYARKKRDADSRSAFQVDNAGDLARALRDIDADLEDKRKTRADEARKKRLDDERSENTRLERERDTELKTETRDDRAALAEDRRAQAEARRAELAGKELKQASEELAGRARGGASYDDLRRIAQDDPRMANVDDSFIAAIRDGSVEAQRAEREKIDAGRAESAAKLKTMDEQAKAAARRGIVRPKTPQQIEDDETKRRTAKAKADKAEADANLAKTKNTSGGKQMAPADIGGLVSERNNLAAIARIREMTKDPDISTGLLASRINNAQATVSDQAKWTKFTSALQAANKLIARAIEGGRMTDADGAFYQRILANPEQGPQQLQSILDLMEEFGRESLDGKVEALQQSGYLVPEAVGGKPTARSDAPPKPAAAAPTDDIDAELDAVNKRIKELEAQQ